MSPPSNLDNPLHQTLLDRLQDCEEDYLASEGSSNDEKTYKSCLSESLSEFTRDHPLLRDVPARAFKPHQLNRVAVPFGVPFAAYGDQSPYPFAVQNSFRTQKPNVIELPQYEDVTELLPQPLWPARPDIVAAHDASWQIAFGNLRNPKPHSGFVSPYIDEGFSRNIFLWDTCFMMFFGAYADRAFSFQGSLDNFYAKAHDDGFIPRQISEIDGLGFFEKNDPSSTGPNLLALTEVFYSKTTGDPDRLARAFAPIVAYHRWMRRHRTWPSGAYFATGWSSGMDNSPRAPHVDLAELEHGHMSWVDTTMQAALSARLILDMAKALGQEEQVDDIRQEWERLRDYANEFLWDDEQQFYFDRYADGSLSDVKTIGSYWALLAGIVPDDRVDGFLAHLKNPNEFNRPTGLPTLSADHEQYDPQGGYWLGADWSNTTYMVLKGLEYYGQNDLAHDIAMKHVNKVAAVYQQTGTLWENYSADSNHAGLMPAESDDQPRDLVQDNFVGWTGLSMTSILYEFVYGLKPDVENKTLVWDLRLTDELAFENYRFGRNGVLSLSCKKRRSSKGRPKVTIQSNADLTLVVYWGDGQKQVIQVKGHAG